MEVLAVGFTELEDEDLAEYIREAEVEARVVRRGLWQTRKEE